MRTYFPLLLAAAGFSLELIGSASAGEGASSTAVQTPPMKTRLWAYKAASELNHPPVVAGDSVVVASTDAVVSLDASTGAIRWTAPADLPQASPSVVGTVVAVTMGNGDVVAMNLSDGRVLFTDRANNRDGEPVVGDENVLLVHSVMGEWRALDARTGTTLWSQPGKAAATVTDGLALVGQDGKLYARDLKTGGIRWALQLDTKDDVYAIVHGDVVLVVTPHSGGSVYRMDLATGSRLWSIHLPWLWDALVADDGAVYVAGASSRGEPFVQAVDAATGQTRWTEIVTGEGADLVGAGSDTVVVRCAFPQDPEYDGEPSGFTYFGIETEGGTRRWQLDVPGYGRDFDAVVAGGSLFVIKPDGTLAALDLLHGRKQWSARLDPKIEHGTVLPPVRMGNVIVEAFSTGIVKASLLREGL